MFKRVLPLPSPAVVISMIALALVLGGTAVAATTGGGTKAETKLIKKLAPTLSVRHAVTADLSGVAYSLAKVSYVKGTIVDAPANGGSGIGEAVDPSVATCPAHTALIGSSANAGGLGVETSPAGITGSPPDAVKIYFDNFTNTDFATNYAIAICAPAASVSNPSGLAAHEAARH